MESFAWISLMLVALQVAASEIADNFAREVALPEYLRGIGWTKVEDMLEQDLRIGNDLVPLHYFLDLTIDVRGHNNAEKSTLSGRVSIDLNITTAVKGIEIHAVGLDIKEATISLPGKSEYLRTTVGRINALRETVTLFDEVQFQPSTARLVITYNGTAHRNRYGLFETWSRMDGELPQIALATFTSPTGARFWFPSFDEPDKKATFQLTVNHPSTLNAYSNTREISSGIVCRNRTRTVFATTPLLPTYLLAISLNNLPFESITYRNHTVRAFGPGADLAVPQSFQALKKLWNDQRFDGVPFLAEKTDIFIFEDLDMALEYPGMMVLAVGMVENIEHLIEHEFLHMYFGNLVTPSTFDDAWIIEGFATLIPGLDAKPSEPVFASLHESPVYKNRRFINSISSGIHYSDSFITYEKSAQILDIMQRINGFFWINTRNILLSHEFGNIDAALATDILSRGIRTEYDRNLFSQLITQVGKGLIVVNQINNTVHLEKMRFHSSYFDAGLRDSNTPILPILPIHSLVGKGNAVFLGSSDKHLTLSIPENSSFAIYNHYWALMEVIYETPAPNVGSAFRSIFAAVEIGYFTFDKLFDNIRLNLHLFDKNTFNELSIGLRKMFFPEQPRRAGNFSRNCTERDLYKLFSDYENKSLAETRQHATLVNGVLLENLICGFHDASDYERFLHHTFIEIDPLVRGRDLFPLLVAAELGEFSGVFADFFFGVYAKRPNPFLGHELLRIIDALFIELPMTDRQAEQLREFVRSNTALAASLSEKIILALERHYVERKRREFYNVTEEHFDTALEQLRSDLIVNK